ncbi:Nif3-like dinuclear metal center hexameric protein [Paenibacillus sp. 1P07SE]|uniref:Nif3-like dinuclear metal center hexameric protein n=1 Tax=Paenibacillus sp. 1P07SE TaxID=3132209 RepID=UPI0039A61C3C
MKRTIGEFLQAMKALSGDASSVVDGWIYGDPQWPVTGVAVVFSATLAVLEEAAGMGANLIIAHEGPYYSHHPGEAWLAGDPVYLYKKRWIEERQLAIYRNHDHWHRRQPDGIMQGLLRALQWETHVETYLPTAAIVTLSAVTLAERAGELKERLGAPFVRLAGDPAMTSRRIGLLAGYRGSAAQALPLFSEHRVDTVIAGEGPEWELPDYIADACRQGSPRGLLLLGHAVSEEPGMRYLAEELQAVGPDVPVRYIAGQQPFAVR